MADPKPPRPGVDPMVSRILDNEKRTRELEGPSGTQRALAVARLPLQDFRIGQAQGFGLSAGWVTYTSVSLPVPEGKRRLQVIAIGTAAVLDMTSGGLTSSYGRIVINGTNSREFPAAKDSGSSFVNNVITATSGADLDVTGMTTVEVLYQLQPLNAAAFGVHVQNFAQLAVTGSFTIT